MPRKPVRPTGRPSRWSILIVPHGGDATRELVVTRRTLRTLRTTVVTAAVMIGAGMASTAAMAAWEQPKPATGAMMASIGGVSAATVDSLRKALLAVAQREARIRVLAGLPPADSGSLDSIARPGTRDVDGLLRRAERLATSFEQVSDSLETHADRLASLPSIMPTAGWLTSQFSRARAHPILHVSRPHEGIDLAAPMGTPIVAPADGRVTRVARERGYGLVLEIDHGNGIVTKFAHTSRVLVTEGQSVTRGQTVANVGNSGLSTGPHLHYEIHLNGRVVDPLTFVLPGGAIPD